MTRRDAARLLAAARSVRAKAYAPYSHYRVGAALLTKSGAIHVGCNVENATYGATLCAERAAVAAMVAAGDSDPVGCAVVTAGPKPGSPCGICRQVLSEFARDLEFLLLAESDDGEVLGRRRASLRALLPDVFKL